MNEIHGLLSVSNGGTGPSLSAGFALPFFLGFAAGILSVVAVIGVLP
jgi:hypothetical protein